MCERYINWFPLARTPRGTWGPTTQARVLTGSHTSDLWVHRPALSPLNHTSQDPLINFFWKEYHVYRESSGTQNK